MAARLGPGGFEDLLLASGAGAGRGAVVRRLLAVDESGAVSRLHVKVAAELAGVSERTVWRWLAEGRAGKIEARPRQGGFALSLFPEGSWRILRRRNT